MSKILITRHPDVIKLLKELKVIDSETTIIDHATAEDIKGKEVIGILPIDLAAHCSKVHSIIWNIPIEARGRDWTYEETKRYYSGIKTYIVREIPNETK